MIEATRESAQEDLQEACAKIEMVRQSLVGLDGEAFQQAYARLERVEVELVRLEQVITRQMVAVR